MKNLLGSIKSFLVFIFFFFYIYRNFSKYFLLAERDAAAMQKEQNYAEQRNVG